MVRDAGNEDARKTPFCQVVMTPACRGWRFMVGAALGKRRGCFWGAHVSRVWPGTVCWGRQQAGPRLWGAMYSVARTKGKANVLQTIQ